MRVEGDMDQEVVMFEGEPMEEWRKCDAVPPLSGNSHAPWWCRTHDAPIGVVAEVCAAVVAERAKR